MAINITLKTINKVRIFLKRERNPISTNFISEKTNIHFYRVQEALKQLHERGEIRKISNSTGVVLYERS